MTDNTNDTHFMQLAINEAKNAPFPFGCILVKDNQVIATGRSGETDSFDPTAHAEINAIRNACKTLQSKDLSGVTLYSTCEPCPMCFSAAWWANIETIVFGIALAESSNIFGQEILVNADYLNKNGGSKIKLQGGVLKDEILTLIQQPQSTNTIR